MANTPQEKKRVSRIVQSPMNPLRWCYELECGHDVWVTMKRRPQLNVIRIVDGETMIGRRMARCPQCST